MRRLLATGVFLVLPLAAAAQQAAPTAGRQMAERWCMACHTIEGKSAVGDRGPSFAAIARTAGMTSDKIAARLSTGHLNMPDFRLSEQEKAALIAYLLSQK